MRRTLLGLLAGLLVATAWGQSLPMRLKVSTDYRFTGSVVNNNGQRLTRHALQNPAVGLMWPTPQGHFHEAWLAFPAFSHGTAEVPTWVTA